MGLTSSPSFLSFCLLYFRVRPFILMKNFTSCKEKHTPCFWLFAIIGGCSNYTVSSDAFYFCIFYIKIDVQYIFSWLRKRIYHTTPNIHKFMHMVTLNHACVFFIIFLKCSLLLSGGKTKGEGEGEGKNTKYWQIYGRT